MKAQVLAAMLALGCFAAEAGVFDVAVGDTVELPAATFRGGKALPALSLQRIDVYAPGARLWQVGPAGTRREIRRSRERHFIATQGPTRAWLAVSADGLRVTGEILGPEGLLRVRGKVHPRGIRLDEVAPPAEPAYECGNDAAGGLRDPRVPARRLPGLPQAKAAGTHQAVVAIDTDNEFMTAKFGTDTVAAADYLGQLFAGLNAIYERDLRVRLVQGTTLLRVAPDAYSEAEPRFQLMEVAGAWSNSPFLQGVPRAFVMLLSGKSPLAHSSRGIAWLLDSHDYCSSTGQTTPEGVFGHYSVTQVFRFDGAAAASDVALVAHELGHGFGVNHTHCTDRITGEQPVGTHTIDQCHAGEAAAGCYAGPLACPVDGSVPGRGSVMSYCHLSGCGPVLPEFHPSHELVLAQRVAANVASGCLAPLVAATVFADGFE